MILPIHHDRSTSAPDARPWWTKKRLIIAGGVLASVALTGCLGGTERRSPASLAPAASVSARPTASPASPTPRPSPTPGPSATPTPAAPTPEPAEATQPPAAEGQEQAAPSQPVRRAAAVQKPARKEPAPRETARNQAPPPPVEHRPRAAAGSHSGSSPKRSVRETTAPAKPKGRYKNCAEARAAGVAPIKRGQPGYSRKLDRDNDGIACE
ncbi:MAG: excalibur calcium-binding domain-containing protein [Propionibacteriaceae bacterium]|nr:excalibur calcium-binding domain-containing protein [Propionibacteriaceae bacterium]